MLNVILIITSRISIDQKKWKMAWMLMCSCLETVSDWIIVAFVSGVPLLPRPESSSLTTEKDLQITLNDFESLFESSDEDDDRVSLQNIFYDKQIHVVLKFLTTVWKRTRPRKVTEPTIVCYLTCSQNSTRNNEFSNGLKLKKVCQGNKILTLKFMLSWVEASVRLLELKVSFYGWVGLLKSLTY